MPSVPPQGIASLEETVRLSAAVLEAVDPYAPAHIVEGLLNDLIEAHSDVKRARRAFQLLMSKNKGKGKSKREG